MCEFIDKELYIQTRFEDFLIFISVCIRGEKLPATFHQVICECKDFVQNLQHYCECQVDAC